MSNEQKSNEQKSNEQKMKDFINALLKEYYPDLGDIDGGTFQDIAEQHGILIAEVRYKPCGEFCNCNEVVYDEEWLEGVKCFRPANWLSAQQRAHPTSGSLRGLWASFWLRASSALKHFTSPPTRG